MRNVLALSLALTTVLMLSTAHAQIGNLDNTTIPPTPGVGHDFIKMLGETVNPANGSLSLRIDLPMPKGRGLDLPLAIMYSSSGVQHLGANQNGGGSWINDAGQSTGSGWSVSVPTMTTVQGIQNTYHQGPPPYTESCYYYYAYVMRDWSATPHAFSMQAAQAPYAGNNCSQQLSNNLNGADDFMFAVTTAPNNAYSPNPATVAGPDGSVYKFDLSQVIDTANGSYIFGGAANSIEDRNGNLATASFQLSNGALSGNIVDTLGRQVFSASAIVSNSNTIQVSGLGAAYTQYWQTVPINFSVNSTQVGPNPCTSYQLGPDQSSTYVVSSLKLPNQKSFQFYYDSQYGLLKKIVYPGGGYISYTWGLNPLSDFISLPGWPLNSGFTCDTIYDFPAITQRTVSYDGVNIAEQQTFSYTTSWPPAQQVTARWTTKTTTVTTKDCARASSCSTAPSFTTVYTYAPVNASVYAPQFAPMEQSIVYKDFNGAVLKTATKAWQDHFLLGCELQTLDNGLISGTWFSYARGQLTDKKEYDYGLITSASSCQPVQNGGSSPPPTGITPTRETVTAYQPFPATPIYPSTPSIFNKPASVITYDNGTRLAETDYGYDQTAVSNVSPTATGHDETNYGASYNNRGNLTTRTVKCLQSGCVDAVTTFKHDETGQVTSMIDPCGNAACSDMAGSNHTTTFSYTDNYSSGTPPGNTNAYLTGKTDPLSHSESFAYRYSDGQLASQTDVNGKTTSYIYNTPPSGCSFTDGLDRLSEIDYPDQGRTTYCYNDASPSPNVTKTTLIDNTVSPNLQISTTTVMDGLGHEVQTQLTTDPEGTDKTDTTYDGLGRVMTQSNPYRSVSDPTYGTTSHSYDSLGRVKSVVQTDGSTTATSYSGNCTTVTDETSRSRKSCTDGLGRLTQVFEDPSGLNYETDYQYNGFDATTGVVQKGGSAQANWRSRSFQYDSLSRLTSATNPESGTISYSYDANGNITSKISPKQNQTNPNTKVTLSYCYDALNRLTSKAYTAQPCPMASPAATFAYDQGTNGIGRRTGMTDSPGSASWVYDLMGRVASETRVTAGATKTTSYAYNQDGSIKSITYPSTRAVNYSYSGAGRVLSAIDPTGPINYVTSATYAPPGELATYVNGFVSGVFTGITTANTYNTRMQPVLISAASPTSSIFSLCYDFHLHVAVNLPPCSFSASTAGDNGNVYQIVNNRDGNRTQNFTYDALNRIQQAYTNGSNWGETYGSATAPGGVPTTPGIDAWGNLWQRSAVTGKTSYEPLSAPALNNNQLTGFGYDAAGNMTSYGTIGYNYDAENRMTKFVGDTTDIYIYDGDGQRVKKTASGVTLYWYGATGNVLDETSSTGTLVSEYIFFNGKRVARRDADNSVKYYFSDNLGSASVITNNLGAMPPVEESDYYPYGGEITITNGDPNHYKFTGKERDAESGLDNFGARYFTSNLGRFMTPDWAARPTAVPYAVFGDPQSLNLYTYVENEPLNRVDADGHCGNDSGFMGSGASYACVTEAKQSQDNASQKTAESAQSNQPKNQSAQETQKNQSQVSAASVGVMALPALGRAIAGAEGGGEAGGAGGTAVEPGGGTVVGALAGAATGAVVAVVAPEVYSKAKDEAGKAWTKFQTGVEHLGKLAGPNQDPRKGWKQTVRRVADDMDRHADRMTGHKGVANAIRFGADLLRGLIPNDPI